SGTVTEGVVKLAYGGMSREELEDLALWMQDFLDRETVDLADGASASVDFEASTIEIDLSIDGDSPGALTEIVGALLSRLQERGVLRTVPLVAADETSREPLTVLVPA
ncbi:MAG TPA: hypothetical protein VHM72_10090, partial [Solirubrobacteraceae bacterium]|nr:hypothetical protein [Solirubrobacteraceae bacterium]